MKVGHRTEDQLRINADLPEPIPSIVKIVRAIELRSDRVLRYVGGLISLISVLIDQSLELADLLHFAVSLIYERLQGYSVGLVKYASAHGSGGAIGTASATIIPPEEQ